MLHTLHPIGTVQSPYAQKFGIPRQPQLVPAAETIITLNPEFTADSVRGLDGFDYIWLQFLFHDAIGEGWAQMVRPPRLGGKQKMGVFATPQPAPPPTTSGSHCCALTASTPQAAACTSAAQAATFWMARPLSTSNPISPLPKPIPKPAQAL